jgi:hypothetical protein
MICSLLLGHFPVLMLGALPVNADLSMTKMS